MSKYAKEALDELSTDELRALCLKENIEFKGRTPAASLKKMLLSIDAEELVVETSDVSGIDESSVEDTVDAASVEPVSSVSKVNSSLKSEINKRRAKLNIGSRSTVIDEIRKRQLANRGVSAGSLEEEIARRRNQVKR